MIFLRGTKFFQQKDQFQICFFVIFLNDLQQINLIYKLFRIFLLKYKGYVRKEGNCFNNVHFYYVFSVE